LIPAAAIPRLVTAPSSKVAPEEKMVSQICASMFGWFAKAIVW
jgi:hypothetical protein